eukprot:CAMPEP_0185596818 /NCGR_PEP_ID=MMETSP0434-20130131/80974_1 /TAXON_ID=626734 ORGANISM="Favella taraikaensis, Strain Fe Narragansett Bay" /NCGR_SAMPLE_ID=MMETSP0434 /ASSEMBLY_ACC=CAM_ASM_000379 /LENGTH=85 /DNA_ID=CAMNT_0028225379 /DNA_START=114 /DNA_END=368 /DNA_ORIENTATION=-
MLSDGEKSFSFNSNTVVVKRRRQEELQASDGHVIEMRPILEKEKASKEPTANFYSKVVIKSDRTLPGEGKTLDEKDLKANKGNNW